MRKFSLILVLFLIISCSDESQEDSNPLSDWSHLAGNWSVHGLEFRESWKSLDDSTLVGKAYKLENGDTLVSEIIELKYRNGLITYTPLNKSKKIGYDVVYKGSRQGDTELVFTNNSGIFPGRVIYFKRGKNQVDVRLEELKDGNIGQTYDLIMTRDQ